MRFGGAGIFGVPIFGGAYRTFMVFTSVWK